MDRRVRSLIHLTLTVAAALLLQGHAQWTEPGRHPPGSVHQEQPAPGRHEGVEHLPPQPTLLRAPAPRVSGLHEAHREGNLVAPRDDLVHRAPVRVQSPRERLGLADEAVASPLGVLPAAFAGPAGRIPFIAPHPSFPPRTQLQCGASLAAAMPNPVSASLDCKMGQLGFSVGGGLFSHKFGISSLDARARIDAGNIEARLRWYPFGRAFFLGGALGYQSLHLKVEKDVEVDFGLWTETVTATVQLETRRVYATPHLGWELTFAKHATVGLEVGALVPIAPRTTVDVSLDSHGGLTVLAVGLADLFGMDDLAEDKVKQVGRYPLPYFAVRAGWTF
jgi:hypothetical protein